MPNPSLFRYALKPQVTQYLPPSQFLRVRFAFNRPLSQLKLRKTFPKKLDSLGGMQRQMGKCVEPRYGKPQLPTTQFAFEEADDTFCMVSVVARANEHIYAF